MVIKTQTNKIFFLILIIISFFAKNSFAEIKAEPLNLKLQCKFIDGFILMNDKVSQRKISAKDFFINLEVIKLNKRVISKITNNTLKQEIAISIDGSGDLSVPFLRAPVGIPKNRNLGIGTVSDESIIIVGLKTNNPDFSWHFSLNRYNGKVSLTGTNSSLDNLIFKVIKKEKSSSSDLNTVYTVQISNGQKYTIEGAKNRPDKDVIGYVKSLLASENSPFFIKQFEGECSKIKKRKF